MSKFSDLPPCLAAPVLLGVVGLFTLGVAIIVFGFQCLIVGAQTYQDPFEDNCQYTIGLWMTIWGAFVVGSFGFGIIDGICTFGSGEYKISLCFCLHPVFGLASLAQFCTVCWGIHLFYNPVPNQDCMPSQYEIFEYSVQTAFWGQIACLCIVVFWGVLSCFVYCCSGH